MGQHIEQNEGENGRDHQDDFHGRSSFRFVTKSLRTQFAGGVRVRPMLADPTPQLRGASSRLAHRRTGVEDLVDLPPRSLVHSRPFTGQTRKITIGFRGQEPVWRRGRVGRDPG